MGDIIMALACILFGFACGMAAADVIRRPGRRSAKKRDETETSRRPDDSRDTELSREEIDRIRETFGTCPNRNVYCMVYLFCEKCPLRGMDHAAAVRAVRKHGI